MYWKVVFAIKQKLIKPQGQSQVHRIDQAWPQLAWFFNLAWLWLDQATLSKFIFQACLSLAWLDFKIWLALILWLGLILAWLNFLTWLDLFGLAWLECCGQAWFFGLAWHFLARIFLEQKVFVG
jgi:hypothetical protein